MIPNTKAGDNKVAEVTKYLSSVVNAGMYVEYDSLDAMLDPAVAQQHHFFHPDDVRKYLRDHEIPTPKDCNYVMAVCKPGTKVAGDLLKVGWGIFVFEYPSMTEAQLRACAEPHYAGIPEAQRETIIAEALTVPQWAMVILAMPPAPLYAAYKAAVEIKDGVPYYKAPWTWRPDCPDTTDEAEG